MKPKYQKQSEAVARQARYDALTIQEKINRVLQKGGSKRELKRLMTAAGQVDVPLSSPKPVAKKKKAKTKAVKV